MAFFAAKHEIQLENGYVLHVIREDRNTKILLSLSKKSDGGWVRERITIEIPIRKAYKMAKFIVGITDAMDDPRIEELEDFEEEETAEFPPEAGGESEEEPGEEPDAESGD